MGKIWAILIALASIYAICSGRTEALLNGILSIPEESFSFLLIVLSSTIFWTGFMYIFKEVGIIDYISLAIKPIFKLIMPNLKDKEAIEYLSMNIAANMFGLGFAATPSGLKGIKRLKEISTMPEGVASDEMITFLVLNTAGVTLLPTTVISIRNSYGSKSPTDFVLFAIISTFAACVFGLIADKLLRRPYRGKL
ncbi:MAG: spore maturation protein A [Erysipelotrichaceae bacterium]|nr:spore maturation protein A [Erysipelotrichaceae bacterium]